MNRLEIKIRPEIKQKIKIKPQNKLRILNFPIT